MNDFYEKSSRGHHKAVQGYLSAWDDPAVLCPEEHTSNVHLYKDTDDSIRGVHIKGITYRGIEADNEKSVHSAKQTQDAPCHQPQQLCGQSIRHITGEICATWLRGHSSGKKLSSLWYGGTFWKVSENGSDRDEPQITEARCTTEQSAGIFEAHWIEKSSSAVF